MGQKVSVLVITLLAAFLVPVGVRAVTPAPLTTVVNVSTVGTQNSVCTPITGGGTVTAISDNFTIPAGHSAYVLPPVFTGLFSSSSTSNPYYTVSWFANTTQLGFYPSYAQPGGLTTQGSFGQEIRDSTALTWFNTLHKGLVAYDFIVQISSPSGQVACVQLPYLSLALVET